MTLKKHRLKKLADQSYLEFPIGNPFGEYNQYTPFNDTRIEKKEPFTNKSFGPKDDSLISNQKNNNSLWLFQAPLDNPEWSLQQTSKRKK